MLINKNNQVLNSMSSRGFRGEAAGLNTAAAQISVIQGLLDSYRITGNVSDLNLAVMYLTAATSYVLEKRNTADTQSAVADAVTAGGSDLRQALNMNVAVTFTAGSAVLNGVDKVLRVLSAGATLAWDHPYADISTGTEYAIKSQTVVDSGVQVELENPVNISSRTIAAVNTAQNIAQGVEVSNWPVLRQVYSRDTQTGAGVHGAIDKMLTDATELTGDPQWKNLADILYSAFKADMATADNLQWFAPTWAENPMAVSGRSLSGSRSPMPDTVRGSDGGLIMTALEATVPGAVTLTQQTANTTLTLSDAVSVTHDVNGISSYTLTVVGESGGRWSILVTTDSAVFTFQASDLTNTSTAVQELPTQAIAAVEVTYAATQVFVFTLSGIRVVRMDSALAPVPTLAYILNETPTWIGPVDVADQPLGTYVRREDHFTDALSLVRGSFSVDRFRPFYYSERRDAITYGAADTYGFHSPFAYRDNGDAQYRILQTLAGYDANTAILSTEVKTFAEWLAEDEIWHPMQPSVADQWSSIIDATIVFDSPATLDTTHNPYGPPTRLTVTTHDTEYPDPAMGCLILSALVDIDTAQRETWGTEASLLVRCLLSKTIALLDALEVRSGIMRGSFSPDPGEPRWHGVWHGQITSAIAKAYRWSMVDRANYPTLQVRCERWLPALNAFLVNNTETPEQEYAGRTWDHRPNWTSPVDESFAFSTRTITSRNGREQRIATRSSPRRRLAYQQQSHELRPSDALAKLIYNQNRPFFVPNWHTPIKLATKAAMGDTQIRYVPNGLTALKTGGTVLIEDGEKREAQTISYTSVDVIYITKPLQNNYSVHATAYPADPALLMEEQNSTWVTNSVSTQAVVCEFLPQTDNRVLPDRPEEWQQFMIDAANTWATIISNLPAFLPAPDGLPEPSDFSFPIQTFTTGGQSLELVTWLNNWRDPVQIASIWTFDLLSKDDGPVEAMGGAAEGTQRVSRTWTVYENWQMVEALSFIKRMKGSQKAFWLPVAVSNLMLSGDQIGGTTITVRNCEVVSAGILMKPYVGIAVVESDGTIIPAKVLTQTITSDIVELTLDRAILEGRNLPERYTVCLVLRVRQSGDVTTLSHITTTRAELKLNMQTVQVLNDE